MDKTEQPEGWEISCKTILKTVYLQLNQSFMITIYKYNLDTIDEQIIEVPKDHEPLTVQEQNGSVCVWFKVDTDSEKQKETILIYGTGNPIEDDAIQYLGTYQLLNGAFVGHVFLKY